MKKFVRKIMLLGSGELGKEFAISAKRLGQIVIAVDRYDGAPAMQVSDCSEVIDMLNAKELQRIVQKHQPDLIVPEIEAIRTAQLIEFESQGLTVIPTAEAAHLTMNRNAIRDVAAKELKLKTAQYLYAENETELEKVGHKIGFPNVVKPVMSSSGKGQSVVRKPSEISAAWKFACEGMRGDQEKVIVEEFIAFDLEITLLTIRQRKGPTLFLDPIGHRQERGDYQESWMPARLSAVQLRKAQRIAKKVTDRLGGAGIFGVEFFIGRNGEVYFSELSPRPHDTGMVTLISQDLSQFDLHVRAVLGLPIAKINTRGPSASAVILADKEIKEIPNYVGVETSLALKNVEVRIFGKPNAKKHRRMGITLAQGTSVKAARKLATKAAALIRVQ